MAHSSHKPTRPITLRLIIDGAEVACATRTTDPLLLSGQAVFDARYRKLLDDPRTHASAVANAARAKAMSDLLGAQDEMLERMALLAARSAGRPRASKACATVTRLEPAAT